MNQTPEQRARRNIDRLLAASGWIVQDTSRIDLHAGLGIAVREYEIVEAKRKETWHPEKNPDGRWRKFSYDEIVARDKTSNASLDDLPDPF